MFLMSIYLTVPRTLMDQVQIKSIAGILTIVNYILFHERYTKLCVFLSSDANIDTIDQMQLDPSPKLATLFWPCVAISLVHIVNAIGYAVQGMQNTSFKVSVSYYISYNNKTAIK